MLEDFLMHATSIEDFNLYFPAVICAEYDSPIDALIGLHVPQDEAQDLVAAAWSSGDARCIVAHVDGGRSVAALCLSDGRWAACNAFLEHSCVSRLDAERRLSKLLKRGKRGLLGTLRKRSVNESAGS